MKEMTSGSDELEVVDDLDLVMAVVRLARSGVSWFVHQRNSSHSFESSLLVSLPPPITSTVSTAEGRTTAHANDLIYSVSWIHSLGKVSPISSTPPTLPRSLTLPLRACSPATAHTNASVLLRSPEARKYFFSTHFWG